MKKKTAIMLSTAVITTLLSFNPPVQAASDPEIRATEYNMDVRLNPHKNQLTEKVTMHVVNNGKQTVKNLLVRNMAHGVLSYDHHHFKATKNTKTTIKSISTDGKKLSYTTGKDKSNLFVNKTLAAGESTNLTVNVITDVPKRADRFGYQAINHGKVYNLSFCFPSLSDYRDDKRNYHPYFDQGENRNVAISNFHVNFWAPKSYKVAASGQNSTKNGKTTINAQNMLEVAIVASNKFKVDHIFTNGVRVNNYYFAGKNSKTYNRLALMTAKDSFNIFTKKIGKYPYKELDMTEGLLGKNTGGMEYPGLVMIDGTAFTKNRTKELRQMGYNELTEAVSHEIGHQWFYSTVGSDEYMEAWLDEGLTNFLENDVYDLTYTKSKAFVARLVHSKRYNHKLINKTNNLLTKAANKFISDPKQKSFYVNCPLNHPQKGVDTDTMAYDVGSSFPAILIVAMGRNKFFQALQDYYHTYYLKQATTQDFLNIIRKYDNSKKVNYVINKFVDPNYLR